MIKRRALIAAGIAGVVLPVIGAAQQPGRTYRIGFLNIGSLEDRGTTTVFQPFVETMSEHGFVEGKNLVIEERAAQGNEALFPTFAAELVAMKVDLLLTLGAAATLAAKQATSRIPIVMVFVTNPVALGLVTSLARPGGNITGLSVAGVGYTAKLLEFVKEAMPARNRVAVLWNPDNAGSAFGLRHTQMPLARELGIELIPVALRSAADLDPGFDIVTRERAQVLLAHPTVWPHRARVIEFAQRAELPLVASGAREMAALGALITYSPELGAEWSRVAIYVVRIFKGAHPGDLPVEQPSKFRLTINLKTARDLSIAIPPALLARADEVLE